MLVRTAWTCDDAHITFRVVDNFLHGYGLRWNVAERVQGYTHPPWLFCLIPCAVIGHLPLTAMLLGIGLTLATLYLLLTKVIHSWQGVILASAMLLFSKAFIDYSTSGLENSLTYLLAVLFLYRYYETPDAELTLSSLSADSACVVEPGGYDPAVFPALLLVAYRFPKCRH